MYIPPQGFAAKENDAFVIINDPGKSWHAPTFAVELNKTATSAVRFAAQTNTDRLTVTVEYADETANPHAYASSDASSASFLSLLREYVERYEGLGRFSDRLAEIDRVAAAMLATYNEMLGLTGVKAAYPNCLLINNCAVYQGCVDAAWLYSVLPECGEKAAEMEAYASRLCEGIETYFWDETSGRYRTAGRRACGCGRKHRGVCAALSPALRAAGSRRRARTGSVCSVS